MSHNIEHRTYTERKSERAITDEINAYVKKATWREAGGGSGLYNRIRFIDKVFPDYDSAYEYIYLRMIEEIMIIWQLNIKKCLVVRVQRN